MDRELMEQTLEKKLTDIDGVIGLAWLRSSVVTFDYQNRTLRVTSPSFPDTSQRLIAPSVKGTAPSVSIRLPFQIVRQRFIVPGSIGEEFVSVMLSTGDTSM